MWVAKKKEKKKTRIQTLYIDFLFVIELWLFTSVKTLTFTSLVFFFFPGVCPLLESSVSSSSLQCFSFLFWHDDPLVFVLLFINFGLPVPLLRLPPLDCASGFQFTSYTDLSSWTAFFLSFCMFYWPLFGNSPLDIVSLGRRNICGPVVCESIDDNLQAILFFCSMPDIYL